MRKLLVLNVVLLAGVTFIYPLPYGVYTFLRILTTITAGLIAYKSYPGSMVQALIAGLISILFNPVIKIYFERETWQIMDLITAGFFLYVMAKHREN